MFASLQRNFSLYSLLAVIIAAQGAVLAFVHNFGNPGVDAICGSALAGLAVVAMIGQRFLGGLVITVPSGVFSVLTTVDGVMVTLLTASGVIIQYVGSATPALTPWVAVILQGLALVAGLFSQLFKTTTALRQARASGYARVKA